MRGVTAGEVVVVEGAEEVGVVMVAFRGVGVSYNVRIR